MFCWHMEHVTLVTTANFSEFIRSTRRAEERRGFIDWVFHYLSIAHFKSLSRAGNSLHLGVVQKSPTGLIHFNVATPASSHPWGKKAKRTVSYYSTERWPLNTLDFHWTIHQRDAEPELPKVGRLRYEICDCMFGDNFDYRLFVATYSLEA